MNRKCYVYISARTAAGAARGGARNGVCIFQKRIVLTSCDLRVTTVFVQCLYFCDGIFQIWDVTNLNFDIDTSTRGDFEISMNFPTSLTLKMPAL